MKKNHKRKQWKKIIKENNEKKMKSPEKILTKVIMKQKVK